MDKQTEKKTKHVYNLIIVDESGSMHVIRKQAFAGMNETIQTIRQMQQKFPDIHQYVTLVTFDSRHIKWHYDCLLATKTKDLTWEDYNPCAATPLYDTVGHAISKLNAQISDEDNVLVTIITDGEENCSIEWNLHMIRTMIEKLKKQNWTFTLIGTDNLDVENMAHTFSIDDHLTFHQDEKGTDSMFEHERTCRERYINCLAISDSVPIGSFFANDKEK